MNAIKRSELWQRLRAARNRAGLRQIDIADHYGIDRTAVTQWESRDPNKRTRPDIDKLKEYARLTRTPLWWLLSDESDTTSEWPLVEEEDPSKKDRPAQTLTQILRGFWDASALKVRERRSDLWAPEIYDVRGPTWMVPLLPDLVTERAAVNLITSARPDFHVVAHRMADLITFERLQKRSFSRKAVLVWRPAPEELPSAFHSYLDQLSQIAERADILGNQLGVRYIEVRDQSEAAEYLVQLL